MVVIKELTKFDFNELIKNIINKDDKWLNFLLNNYETRYVYKIILNNKIRYYSYDINKDDLLFFYNIYIKDNFLYHNIEFSFENDFVKELEYYLED